MDWIRAFGGVLLIVGITYLISPNKRKIDWRLVITGLALQVVLGIIILKVPFINQVITLISSGFVKLTDFALFGAQFIFGDLAKPTATSHNLGFIFAFQVLPIILFFSALTTLLYYLGVLQVIVKFFAFLFTKVLRVSGPESLSAIGNVFIGQAEAPLVIKPYLSKMTRSEIMCVMTIGMCTIAGSVMGAYIQIVGCGNPILKTQVATQLLAASIMNLPAGIVLCKILIPSEHKNLNESLSVSQNQKEFGENVLDALANGVTQGIKLAVNVGGMLLAFVAFIYFANFLLGELIGKPLGVNEWIATSTNGQFSSLSLEYILGQLFRCLAFAIGVDWQESLLVGSLLGKKTAINEFVAYIDLASLKSSGQLSPKSIVISTFALCGFSNFSSIAIQLGGIGMLAPNQRKNLSELGFKALLAGALACLMTGAWAGALM